MTRCAQWSCIFLLLSVFCLSHAFAESSKPHEIYEDFDLANSTAIGNGDFLLVGSIGKPMNATAALLCIDESGQIKWSVSKKDNSGDSSRFFTAVLEDDNKLLAFRTISSEPIKSIISTIENGSIADQIEQSYQVFAIFAADDGFLEFSKPYFEAATLKKISLKNGLMWEKNFKEPWEFSDILRVKDGYIAFGTHTSDRNDSPVGIVVKFDLNGNIVWKHLSSEKAEFKSGVCVSDDSVVLVGDTFTEPGDPQVEESWPHAFIAQYDENGLVWQTDYKYGKMNWGYMRSIVQIDEGFLVACKENKPKSEIRLIQINEQGKIMKEWRESTGNLYRTLAFSLHHTADGNYLIAGGEDTERKKLTIVKKINVPSN